MESKVHLRTRIERDADPDDFRHRERSQFVKHDSGSRLTDRETWSPA